MVLFISIGAWRRSRQALLESHFLFITVIANEVKQSISNNYQDPTFAIRMRKLDFVI